MRTSELQEERCTTTDRPAPPPRPGSVRRCSTPDFRRLLAALAASQLGDWLYNLALLALVFERTRSATWVAVTTAARIAPLLLAPARGRAGRPLGPPPADGRLRPVRVRAR